VKELPSRCKTTFGYYLYINTCLFVVLQVGYTCKYVCTIYIYILNIYTCIYMYLYICTHTHIHIVGCTCMYVCNIQIYVLNIYTYIICVYIYMYMYIYVYVYSTQGWIIWLILYMCKVFFAARDLNCSLFFYGKYESCEGQIKLCVYMCVCVCVRVWVCVCVCVCVFVCVGSWSHIAFCGIWPPGADSEQILSRHVHSCNTLQRTASCWYAAVCCSVW